MYCDLMILRMFRILTFVKSDYTPFFHFASFVVCIFFLSFKKRQLMEFLLIHPVIHLLLRQVIRLVIWNFPIWLTSSSSYSMVIFSANEIRTFFRRLFNLFQKLDGNVGTYYLYIHSASKIHFKNNSLKGHYVAQLALMGFLKST